MSTTPWLDRLLARATTSTVINVMESAALGGLYRVTKRLRHPGAQALSKFAVLQSVRNFLSGAAGLTVAYDQDGDLAIERTDGSGSRYWVLVGRTDSTFLSVVRPKLYTASAHDRHRAMLAASHATATARVAKVFFTNNNVVSAAVEMYVDSPNGVVRTFDKAIAALDQAAVLFSKFMAESPGRPVASA